MWVVCGLFPRLDGYVNDHHGDDYVYDDDGACLLKVLVAFILTAYFSQVRISIPNNTQTPC